jgi:hypothetical protein
MTQQFQNNNRGSNAPSSIVNNEASDDDIAAVLAKVKKPASKAATNEASDDDIAAVLQRVKAPQATTPSPKAQKPAVAPSNAFSAPPQRELFSNTSPLAKDPQSEVTPFKSLIADDKNFKKVTDYMETIGKPFDQSKQTREEYVKDFMRKMRYAEVNTMDTASFFTRLANTDKKSAAKMADAFLLYDSVPPAWEEDGQSGVRPWAEAAWGAVTDPTNLIGLGAGALIKTGAAKTGGKAALRDMAKKFLVGASVDVPVAVASDYQLQKMEHEVQKRRSPWNTETEDDVKARQNAPFDYNETQGAISVVLSAAGAGVGAAGAPDGGMTTKIVAAEIHPVAVF